MAKYTVLSGAYCLLRYIENCSGSNISAHSMRYFLVRLLIFVVRAPPIPTCACYYVQQGSVWQRDVQQDEHRPTHGRQPRAHQQRQKVDTLAAVTFARTDFECVLFFHSGNQKESLFGAINNTKTVTDSRQYVSSLCLNQKIFAFVLTGGG